MKKAFTTIDILMYLTFMAMIFHFTKPSYEQILMRVKAQGFIQSIKMSQLKVEEYFFFNNDLPSEIVLEDDSSFDMVFDGYSLSFITTDQNIDLILIPNIDEFKVTWECNNQNESQVGDFICHATT